MFSTIRPSIIYIYIFVLYILHWHTENTSLPNGPFIYSVESWPGTKLWAIVRHQKYQHPHCLPAHPKDTTQWPDKTCISKTQPQSSKVIRAWCCITVSFRSAFDSFFDVSASAFLISTATTGEATARLYTFTTFTWSSSGSSLLFPQNSTMEVPWRDSNKTLWPRVHAFELNKPRKWSRNVSVLWKVSLISCCISVYHWYLPTVSILLHF